VAWILALPPLVLVILAFGLPYGASLVMGLGAGRGRLSLVLQVLPTLAFTLKQAALSTLAALVLGLPGAWILSAPETPEAPEARAPKVRRFLRSLSALPFALPPILVVLGFVLFFGNSGWLNRILAALGGWGPLRILYRPEAIILAHGFYNFPLVLRLAGDSMEGGRRAYLPAAASLGASPLGAVPVLLPLFLPGIISAALLVFLYCFTSFAVVLVLGGGPGTSTLAVEIYRYARISLDYGAAGTLALFETAVILVVFLLYLFFEGRLDRINLTADKNRVMAGRGDPIHYLALGLYGLVMVFVALGPVVSIPLESLLQRATRAGQRGFSLYWWRLSGEGVLPALGRSLILAFSSASLSCVLAILAGGAGIAADRRQGRRRRWDKRQGRRRGRESLPALLVKIAAVSPLISSGIVLGLGWLILYGRDNSRSFLAVMVIHAVAALPFAFHSVSRGLKGLAPNVMGAGTVFGAGPFARIFTLALPLASGRLRSAWAFAATISLGELNAIMMLGMDWETLPLFIYRAAGAYRYGAACVAGTLLILCCLFLFLLSDIGGRRGT
jgi:thiamine transport system permease protein